MGVSSNGIQRFFHKPAKFQTAAGNDNERELQDKLYGLFLGMHSIGIESIKRAYIASVQYDGVHDERLAICLVADRATADRTADAIGKIFEQVYTKGQLDVLFVSREQEEQVKSVTRPFFNA